MVKKRWRVVLQQTVVSQATFEVEADTRKEAEEAARNAVEAGDDGDGWDSGIDELVSVVDIQFLGESDSDDE